MYKKYLHCGNCWNILGEIPASDPERIFDTMDCGWECKCGRYNVSSDGIDIKKDSEGDSHYIYFYGNEERSLLKIIPNGFYFNRDNFNPRLFIKPQ
jgi:hypothetical protein